MPAYVAGLAVTGFGLTTATTAGAIVYGATYLATAYALSYAAQELLAPSANKTANSQNRALGQSVSNAQGVIGGSALSTTVRQSAAPRRLIYGTIKTGGILVYAKKTSNDRYLHLATYLGEGPIEGVSSTVYLGDKASNVSPLAGLVTRTVYTGAPGQTYSAALAAVSEGEWTAAMVGNGCAWVHTRYEYDPEPGVIGPTLPAFMVSGRLVYDPRTGTTLATATSNPALVMLDFIRSEYGYKAPDQWIDFDTFAAAANVCDEILTSLDAANVVAGVPNRVRRYSLNGAFEVDASPAATVEAIEAACAGKLVFSGGKYRFYAGAYRAPTGPQLTAEYLRADPAFRAHPSRQQRFNIARGTYREPKQDWQDTSIHEQQLGAAIVAEDGEIVQSVTLAAVTNGAQAQRIARLRMMTARSAVPLILKCNYAVFQWRLYDVVDLDLPEVGATGSFLIVGYSFVDISDGGGIDLTLVPHLSSDYAWDHTTMERLVPAVAKPNFDYPAPAATGLGRATGVFFYNGSDQVDRLIYWFWNEPDWAILSHYELQVREGSGDWVTYQVSETKWTTESSPDLTYQARFRNVGLNGKKSGWSSISSVDVYRDTTAPGNPTAMSVASGTAHTVNWTNPTSSNFSRMRVIVGGDVVATVAGRPGSRGSATFAAAAGTVYQLQSESVDGALGSVVTAGTGTTNASQAVSTQIGGAITPINSSISDLDDRVTALESA